MRRKDEERTAPAFLVRFFRRMRGSRFAFAATCFIGVSFFLALLAPLLAPHDPLYQFRDAMLVPPFWEQGGQWRFPLGTDELGRDIFSRLIYGTRLSYFIGFAAVLFSLIPGIFLGLLAAFSKACDALIMRFVDILLALPSILLAVAVMAVLGAGLVNTIVAVSIVALPAYVRLTRGAALGQLQMEYVTASRIAGAGTLRLMLNTVLPNCASPLIVQSALSFSTVILDTAALGFLGLGVQPPFPEWGQMLASARDYIVSAWWVVTMPGLLILLNVLSINIIGDKLRDILDPSLKDSQL